jgi:hypothetical protein
MPVTVTLNVPVAAVLAAEKVSELVVLVSVGLKAAVTPVGNPEADKLTTPLKPFSGVTLIVLLPPAPCAMLKVLGEAEST